MARKKSAVDVVLDGIEALDGSEARTILAVLRRRSESLNESLPAVVAKRLAVRPTSTATPLGTARKRGRPRKVEPAVEPSETGICSADTDVR